MNQEIYELQDSLDEKIEYLREALYEGLERKRMSRVQIEQPVSKVIAQSEIEGELIYNIEKEDEKAGIYTDFIKRNGQDERFYLNSEYLYADEEDIRSIINPSLVEYMISVSELDRFLGECYLRGLLTQEDVEFCQSYSFDNEQDIALSNFINLISQNVVNLRKKTSCRDLMMYVEEDMNRVVRNVLGHDVHGRIVSSNLVRSNISSQKGYKEKIEIQMNNGNEHEIEKNSDGTFNIT